ncbi:MAG: GHKL domain-containing protein [Calditrichaeota bacterium]|nr:MAG: GHKL domain-containing protein [Calditrichota bacterium]
MNVAQWTNYFLVLSLGALALLAFLVARQRVKTIQMWIFLYLLILFLLEVVATLNLVNTTSFTGALLSARIRALSELFSLLLIYYLVAYALRFHPFIDLLAFKRPLLLAATLVACGHLFGLYFGPLPEARPPIRARFFYGLYLLFAAFLITMVISALNRWLHFGRRQEELHRPRQLLRWVVPLLVLSMADHLLMPIFHFHPRLLLLSYPLVTGILLVVGLSFHLLEADVWLERISGLYFLSGAGIFLGYLGEYFQPSPAGTLVSAVLMLAAVSLGLVFLHGANWTFQRLQHGGAERYEQLLAQITTQVNQFIELPPLWDYVGEVIEREFYCQYFAVLYPRAASPPYELGFSRGLTNEAQTALLSPSGLQLLQTVENQGQLLNKFSLPVDNPLFDAMDRLNLYVLIPVLQGEELKAILAVGGQRKFVRISPHQLGFFRMLAHHLALSMETVQKIQQSMQAAKLADLGMFASQLAHDFRSFIALVKLENLENHRLVQHAAHMEKLVQDLLQYARPAELRLMPCNINHLIDMSLDLINLPENVSVEKNYATDLPDTLLDVNQMQRVFTNLLENAVRAMRPNGGRIKITTRKLRPISGVKRNPWIYIEILDEGEGIGEEFLNRIFDPFFTTHKREGGSGMGLAIVKQIIERHSGYIDVTSKEGKGTIFNIRLPYVAETVRKGEVHVAQ